MDTRKAPELIPYMEMPEPMPIPEMALALESILSTSGPYINIGFECDVSAGEIVAIKTYVARDDLALDFTPRDIDSIRTVVKLRDCPYWFPSSLTHTELRDRIRKASKTDEIFI